jgi:pimeloyl-ACP methyl ester carboxylesterase
MSETRTIRLADGRVTGFIDYGPATAVPVLWCHGGPGSRLEPAAFAPIAAAEGFRLIGIDRPGYGRSTRTRTQHRRLGVGWPRGGGRSTSNG